MIVNWDKIPTTADADRMEFYVQNILRTYGAASAAQIAKGTNWYPVAHDIAVMIGAGDVRKGAGVIAALSVQKSWAENIRLATDAGNGNLHGHMGTALRKAGAILDGTAPEDVLPMSAKTGNFYRNIVSPDDADAVTVDRHAHDIAVGMVYGSHDRGLSNATRYATIANAYRIAAKRLGVTPSVVQAVTWTVQVEILARTEGNR